ncbi:hypothetical protein CN884_07395 [Ochrobactrum sp. 30A/1000/2015]|uniref:Uncharacterized protein n=1 Tax=Brucella intermedia M86 TaxID=1234597 RepID=M5JR06_9HYPH|nr:MULTISPECIES: hypothetical protein [Brucella]PJT24738.1 hypothetical protein CN884_07395 [Ochrobactrum sp. 30A/1000/2015]PJT37055.1 hypothetical protein CN883_20380 [Ochrobactrum sp. 27A/999/2015]PJT42114.1 hypothetical protein CN882_21180 [Ochrobactrum sp. 23A/997/2015]ELT50235.1 hypothetical protein D584_04803 [Brucella intermedia M86]KIU68395.1 hypothetical protein TR92_10995 [Brucella anthropi]
MSTSQATARAIVEQTISAALPAGSPLPYASIGKAAFEGRNSIVASLTMFDGLPAVCRLKRWAFGWSKGWDSLPGGDISIENGAWARVSAPSEGAEE